MSAPERGESQQAIVGDVMQHLTHIVAMARSPFSENAHFLSSLLTRNVFEIEVIDPGLEEPMNWAVDFRLGLDSNDRRLAPVVFVDPLRYGSLSDRVKESELARTIALVEQFPRNFDQPIRRVYTNALAAQRKWLGPDPSGVLLDPRTVPERVIIRQILGDRAYFSDFGFFEWQQALEQLRTDYDEHEAPVTGEQREVFITQLQHDKTTFYRSRLQHMFYSSKQARMTDDFRATQEARPFGEIALLNARHAAIDAIKYQV